METSKDKLKGVAKFLPKMTEASIKLYIMSNNCEDDACRNCLDIMIEFDKWLAHSRKDDEF